MPDLELWDVRQLSMRLYELLREPGYLLFVFVTTMRLRTDRELLAALMRSINEGYGEIVRPRVGLDEGVPRAAETPELIDFKGQFRGKPGTERGSVLLVRPDGYAAVHRKGFDPRPLSAALAPWAGWLSLVTPGCAAGGCGRTEGGVLV